MLNIYFKGFTLGDEDQRAASGIAIENNNDEMYLCITKYLGNNHNFHEANLLSLYMAISYAIEKNEETIIYGKDRYIIESFNRWSYRWTEDGSIDKRPNAAIWKRIFEKMKQKKKRIRVAKARGQRYDKGYYTIADLVKVAASQRRDITQFVDK